MNKVFIIAEAGVNHNGSLELAFELCNAAKQANADAIKFQTWKTELIITKDVSMADYQLKNLGVKKTQFEMAKELELSYDDFTKIKKFCDEIGIQFLSTPDEATSLDFLLSIDMNLIKVGSGEISNIPYLRQIGSKKREVILSTGMSNLGDIEYAYNLLIESGVPKITLLHCTTNYPCPMNEVNLNAMLTLKKAFNCRIGYSDHTEGIVIPIAAVAMGAEIIEKHITLDKSMEGPDHIASINPSELKDMVSAIRNIEEALGNGIKQPNKSEVEISKVVLKRIVALKKIKKGSLLSSENITVKRSSSGIPSSYWDLIEGSKAGKDFAIDESILFQDISLPNKYCI
jgi:N,N'-diacetyllegionaminate synthase